MNLSARMLLTTLATLIGVPQVSFGEYPPYNYGPPAGNSVQPSAGQPPRALTNDELFRILFEDEQSRPSPTGYSTRPVEYTSAARSDLAPPPPMTDMPAPEPGPMPQPMAGGPGCTAGCGACASCCEEDCPAFWEHLSGVYGEWLFLTPRNADVHFASQNDGLGINAVPLDRARLADPDYDSGFRVGGQLALTCTSSLTGGFTWYSTEQNDLKVLAGGNGFLDPTLVHPNTRNVVVDVLAAEADYEIEFLFADIAFQKLLRGDCKSRLNAVGGFRYGRLDQEFTALYTTLDLFEVDSDLEFDGFGPRVGLDGAYLLGRGCFFYGNAFGNLLVGQVEGDFLQRSATNPNPPQANSGFEDDRIVPVLEMEVGFGWQSHCRKCEARVGYYLSGWYNVATTADFIDAVQTDNFDNVDDTLTFDGLSARLQWNY